MNLQAQANRQRVPRQHRSVPARPRLPLGMHRHRTPSDHSEAYHPSFAGLLGLVPRCALGSPSRVRLRHSNPRRVPVRCYS